MVLKRIKIDQEDNMAKKTTEEVTKDILDVEFENISKEKLFNDEGYMEDEEDTDVAEVVPISKEKSPLEKDVYPQGRREKFKNKDKPNPFRKA